MDTQDKSIVSARQNRMSLLPSVLGLLSASVAFLFYGGWGYWINLEHGHATALTVFLAQGGYSFVLTLTITLLIESLYKCFSLRRHWSKAKLQTVTIFVSCLIAFLGSWFINMAANTPEILTTVLLGYVIGGFYTCAYVLGFSRRQPTSESVCDISAGDTLGDRNG